MACNARIVFGDDHGDNETTFHCKLEEGHEGKHQETGEMYGQPYMLTWEGDDKDDDEEIWDEEERIKSDE
jgi:hypothetical protein